MPDMKKKTKTKKKSVKKTSKRTAKKKTGKKKHAGGAASKFTKENRMTILKFIRKGNYESTACQAAGISPQTLYNWKKEADSKGSKDAKEKFKFFETCKKARSKARADRLENIRAAAKDGTWQAAAWMLERQDPALYAKKNPDMFTPQQVFELISKIILAINRTVTNGKQRINLSEEIARIAKQASPIRNGNGNGNGKKNGGK